MLVLQGRTGELGRLENIECLIYLADRNTRKGVVYAPAEQLLLRKRKLHKSNGKGALCFPVGMGKSHLELCPYCRDVAGILLLFQPAAG